MFITTMLLKMIKRAKTIKRRILVEIEIREKKEKKRKKKKKKEKKRKKKKNMKK